MSSLEAQPDVSSGSQDGSGAGDHDQTYRFGRRPRSNVPFPFSTREYARLLVLRSRVHDSLGDQDNLINFWQPQAA